MTLRQWVDNGWLKEQASSPGEIKSLFGIVERDIAQASKQGLDPDWKLGGAYNACLTCATIALRVCGFRIPQGEGHHYGTIESLRFIMESDSEIVATLQVIRTNE